MINKVNIKSHYFRSYLTVTTIIVVGLGFTAEQQKIKASNKTETQFWGLVSTQLLLPFHSYNNLARHVRLRERMSQKSPSKFNGQLKCSPWSSQLQINRLLPYPSCIRGDDLAGITVCAVVAGWFSCLLLPFGIHEEYPEKCITNGSLLMVTGQL